MKRIIAAALAALSVTAFAAGCEKSEYDRSPYFFAMAADAAFVLPSSLTEGEKQKDCYKLYAETRALLDGLDLSLSSTLDNSCITLFNNAAAGAKVEIDFAAYEVFSLAGRLYEITDGYYNPAVYYNVAAYGFGSGGNVPQKAEDLPKDGDIEKFNALSGCFGDIILSEENGKYYVKKPLATVEINGVAYSLKVDLGGIGKGYAVDGVNALMDKYAIPYGYFTFGESSLAFRQYTGGDNSYTLQISNPRYLSGGSRHYMTVPVKNECLSTSADNVKYYEIDGVRYCHVIDPVTGKPVQTGIMSATVIGGSAAENDAFTTAIMAMGKEKAQEFIKRELANRRVVFTYCGKDGYEIYTNMQAGGFAVPAENYKVNTI